MCSSLFVVNILGKGFGVKDQKKLSFWGKAIVVIVGALGMLIAIDPPDSILWIITTGFSIMASAFTFPLLAALWWPRSTNAGGVAGMAGGAAAAVFWYVLSYIQNGSLSNFAGGWWPAIVGSIVSLVLVVAVSLLTAPSSDETLELFYGEAAVND